MPHLHNIQDSAHKRCIVLEQQNNGHMTCLKFQHQKYQHSEVDLFLSVCIFSIYGNLPFLQTPHVFLQPSVMCSLEVVQQKAFKSTQLLNVSPHSRRLLYFLSNYSKTQFKKMNPKYVNHKDCQNVYLNRHRSVHHNQFLSHHHFEVRPYMYLNKNAILNCLFSK